MKLRVVFTLALLSAASGVSVSAARGADPTVALAPVRANQSLTMNALLGYINSEPIFVNDMLRPIDEQLRALAKSSHSLEEFKQGAKSLIDAQTRSYVTSILVNSSAKAALSAEDSAKLDLYLNKARVDLLAKYGGSRALADEALKAQGTSVDKELADQRRTLTVQLYLSKQILPKITVTRPMVLEEYQRNPKAWQQEGQVELFTITLPVSRWLREPGKGGERGPLIKNPTPAQVKEAKAMALKEAAKVVGELKHGASFAQLAEDEESVDGRASKGGRTPDVKRGGLRNKMEEDYIFSLPAHTLGAPLLVDDPDPMRATVVVIKIGEKTEPHVISFAEAQEGIRKKLHAAQYDKLSNEYLEGLYKGAAIERMDHMSDTALDVAVARYATQ